MDTTPAASAVPPGPEAQAGASDQDERAKERLLAALKLPGNARCADCDAPEPKWATVTHGAFICTQCAGVHRSLGVHLSFVLSCTLDKWTAAQVEVMEATGNERLNARLEQSLATQAEFSKPPPDAARTERERFIRAKYELQQFASSTGDSPTSRSLQRQAGTRLPTSEPPSSSASATAPTPTHGMVEYVGVLLIDLVEAADLAGMNISGKSDPYVTLRLGEQTISSKHVSNSLSPQWNQKLMLSWDGASPLLAELFDHNKISADRAMGGFEVSAAVLAALHTTPELDDWFPVLMPREWATNFGEHMVAGAEGVGKGFYRGITGVWKDPIKGAKENGFEGFAKGVGTGVAGVVYRPIKGFGTMVKQTALSVGVGKKNKHAGDSDADGGEAGNDLVPAGSVHLVLSLQKFS